MFALKKKKGKRKYVQIVFIMMIAGVFMSGSGAAASYAAGDSEGTVTYKTVSQGINSSDQYVYDGSKTDFTTPDLVLRKSEGVWGYINNGVVQTDVSGLYSNSNGWWYVSGGWVDFTRSGVLKAGSNWYSFSAGKRLYTDNKTLKKNDSGWWYLINGQVDFSYTGLAANAYGVWYAAGGQVDFDYCGVVKDSGKAVNQEGNWYYVDKGEVDFTYTGVSEYANDNGWWYIKNGMVDFTYNGAAENSNGVWYVKNGQVMFDFTGWAYGCYFKNGQAVAVDIQDSLASLGAGFGSAMLTKFQTESLHILAERISDGGLNPTTDTNLLHDTCRGGSHLPSDI